MRRAVILATLTLLVLAVAGVTAAQERPFTNPLAGDQTQSTAPETTSVETTAPETTVPENTAAAPEVPEKPGVGKPDGPHDMKPPKDTRANGPNHTGADRPEHRGPAPGMEKAHGFARHEPAGRLPGVGRPDEPGGPETAGSPKDRGRPFGDERRGAGGPGNVGQPDGMNGPFEHEKHGAGRPKDAGDPHSGHPEPNERGEHGGGQEKFTLCHKGKVTITVGAPARDAHIRHGDSEGACGQDHPPAGA